MKDHGVFLANLHILSHSRNSSITFVLFNVIVALVIATPLFSLFFSSCSGPRLWLPGSWLFPGSFPGFFSMRAYVQKPGLSQKGWSML